MGYTKREFEEVLRQRTRAARERRDMSRAEMALALGVSEANYTKYENRSPLPHWLIPKFCVITGIEMRELLAPPVTRPHAKRA